jgi:hypothetical protein
MTNESKALAVRDNHLALSTWDVIKAVSPTMHQSRFFGVTSPDQAAAIMITGAELGLGLSASFQFIQVVEGKVTLSPRGALALLMSSGELAGFKLESSATSCKVWMKRKSNGFEHTEEFTIDDAKRAGLVKPRGAWETYPKNMLRWRAIGYAIDLLFSDVVGGLKRADEFGASIDTAGNVVEGEWSTMAAAPAPAPEPAVTVEQAASITLQDLVDKHGPDAVMAAAGGKIPGTIEEVAACAAALGT